MKKILSIAIVGVVSLALCTGVMAQDDAKKDTKATQDTKATKTTVTKTETKTVAAKKQQFTGMVTAIDAAAMTITVEKKDKKETKSMIFTAGPKVKLADIKKDSKVTVIYTKDGDKAEAVSVKEAKSAAAKAEKKAVKTEKKTTKTTEKTEKEETK